MMRANFFEHGFTAFSTTACRKVTDFVGSVGDVFCHLTRIDPDKGHH